MMRLTWYLGSSVGTFAYTSFSWVADAMTCLFSVSFDDREICCWVEDGNKFQKTSTGSCLHVIQNDFL